MKFEHIVEINHPDIPPQQQLTLTQLWHGLVLRATAPKLFIPHLDACQITPIDEHNMQRTLQFGKLMVRDQVTLTPHQCVSYNVPAQGEIPESSLNMHIESPHETIMIVRFIYDDYQAETADPTQKMANDFRRSAYLEADLDTVRVIREQALSGQFQQH
ncbi:MAG: DUF1857 family protein [Sulfuriferula sp.]|nr:DUF1857 family protein [Sulfuriferula sp.]